MTPVDALLAELIGLSDARADQRHSSTPTASRTRSATEKTGRYRVLLYGLSVLLLVGVSLTSVRMSSTARLLDEANHDLRQQREYTENVIRSMIDSLMILEPDGRCVRSVEPGDHRASRSFMPMITDPRARDISSIQCTKVDREALASALAASARRRAKRSMICR